MKRIATLISVAAVLTMSIGPVAAAPAKSQLVAGGGWRLSPEDIPRVEFSVNAKFAGTAGGTYRYANIAGSTFTVTITCGSVDGNVAVIGGPIMSGDSPGGLGTALVFFVDNGTPTFGSWGPDEVSLTLIPEAGDVLGSDYPADFPAHCPAAQGDTFDQQQPLRTVIGDLIVH